MQLVAGALGRLGVRHAYVVHGQDGLDELTLNGPTDVAEVQGMTVRKFTVTPQDAG